MTLEEYKKEVGKNIENLFNKANGEEKALLNRMINTINDLCEEKKELIDYLKGEINECKLTGNDEDYIKIDVYEEILSKIEKEQIWKKN